MSLSDDECESWSTPVVIARSEHEDKRPEVCYPYAFEAQPGTLWITAHRQIEELVSRYGRMDILWLDGGQVRPPQMDIDVDRLATMARQYNPRTIMVDRTVGGPHEEILTPEQTIPDEPIDGPWEACATLQKKGWIHTPDADYWSPTELIHRLIRIVSDGGNHLLGIGPNEHGCLAPEVDTRLNAIGEWLETNGEGIYGTRRGDFEQNRANDSVVYTRSKDGRWTYIHLLDWPEDNSLSLSSPPTIAVASEVRMLGCEKNIPAEYKDSCLELILTNLDPSSDHAWVIKARGQQ